MTGEAEVDTNALRRTMGGFATGVAIVTTNVGTNMFGMTVNSLTSVSLEPPLVLVCFSAESRTAEAVKERGLFAVNLLGERQEGLSDYFARPRAHHFEGVEVEMREGLPLIPRAPGYLICETHVVHPAGDHIIVVGLVRRCETREGGPLIFYRGTYHLLGSATHEAQFAWFW